MKGCFRSRWVLCFFHVFFPSARVDIYHHLPRSKKGKLHLEAFPRSNIISLTHPQKIEYLRNGPPKWKDPIAYPVPIVWGIGLYTFNVWPLDAKKQQHIIVLHPVTTRPVITSTRKCGARLVCWMHLPFKLDASLWFNRWLNWIVRAYVDVCMFFNMTEQNSWQTLQAPRTNQSPICPTVAPSLQPFLAESGTITRDLRPFVPSSLRPCYGFNPDTPSGEWSRIRTVAGVRPSAGIGIEQETNHRFSMDILWVFYHRQISWSLAEPPSGTQTRQ